MTLMDPLTSCIIVLRNLPTVSPRPGLGTKRRKRLHRSTWCGILWGAVDVVYCNALTFICTARAPYTRLRECRYPLRTVLKSRITELGVGWRCGCDGLARCCWWRGARRAVFLPDVPCDVGYTVGDK